MSVSLLMDLLEERKCIISEMVFARKKGNSKEYKNWAKALKDITYVIDSERDELDD